MVVNEADRKAFISHLRHLSHETRIEVKHIGAAGSDIGTRPIVTTLLHAKDITFIAHARHRKKHRTSSLHFIPVLHTYNIDIAVREACISSLIIDKASCQLRHIIRMLIFVRKYHQTIGVIDFSPCKTGISHATHR